ncbi:CheR family methyltransferase [Acetivibrio saccincola]|uniref:protein-glutamate O-methyltransferase n=1 Tax=Acetivibrio saccincola TaxID=1677857 RepID=A0A2K9EPX6_9FIRM|nr:protein-glutamate O-methyltransferase CheR [Acetivibrio saccincola]AUG57550.1 Chemotaxis protein methyltransferase Cher2 [Acetivibrio saccincola]NLW26047.1 protein-glutamate O-methyltransferase CheR [Acetivibrio saccincola]PQQ67460.1 chemotaxis protein CheR [Acetivibrio saccincola]HOA97754.1 protein-glutamate O-methyltransferase CheR [Acetivibrio saccincola]HQD29261.1 protein-glutamate O-methyltransferase CheR [Acetivibrio saccincola]
MSMNYEGFKKEIFKLTGIDLNSYKERQMKRRLNSLISKRGFEGYQQYVEALKKDFRLYEEFMSYITINVSEFYRNPDQWVKLKEIILPMIIKENKRLKVWSAACSSGEEPYTIAMILNEFFPLEEIKIFATDLDKEILEKAKKGVYNEKSVANLPKAYLQKYFIRDGNTYHIKDQLKKCIEFKQHNLLSDEYPSNCDLIVCRNVLIYFTEEAKIEIYKKFNRALAPSGVLFVGSTEQILLYTNYNFRPVQTFFYQKERDL